VDADIMASIRVCRNTTCVRSSPITGDRERPVSILTSSSVLWWFVMD